MNITWNTVLVNWFQLMGKKSWACARHSVRIQLWTQPVVTALWINRVLSKCTRLAIMPILASEALFCKNKQNATLVSIEPLDLWFQVQHAPLYTNLAFACKTETLSFLYGHAPLILTKSSKSKHQVVHKFKDLLSSTCQVSIKRSMLDLESEV